MTDTSDALVLEILNSVRTIALVGASANHDRPSHQVARYLLEAGYWVIPVNPGLAGTQILGQTVRVAVTAIPEAIDMVDIFRNAEAAAAVVDEAIAVGARVVWMQLGIRQEAAEARATAAGLAVVMDRCPKIEHQRLKSLVNAKGLT